MLRTAAARFRVEASVKRSSILQQRRLAHPPRWRIPRNFFYGIEALATSTAAPRHVSPITTKPTPAARSCAASSTTVRVTAKVDGAGHRGGVSKHADAGSNTTVAVSGSSRVTGVSEAVGERDSNRRYRTFDVDGSGRFVAEPSRPWLGEVRGNSDQCTTADGQSSVFFRVSHDMA